MLILFFHPAFYLVVLLLPEFFMVVLHDLIHSSRVHQDSCWRSSSIFLLASRSVINSLYSFVVEFCISSAFSAILSFPFVVGYHLIISEMLSISPQQAYSFVVDFLNNSVQSFILRFLSISLVVKGVVFFSVLFIQLFQFFPEVLCHVFIKYHSIFSSSCSIPSIFSRSAA